MDQIVDATTPTAITAYERRIEKLEKDKIIWSEKLQNSTGPKRSYNEMFEMAFVFLSNPWKLWDAECLEDNKMLLKLTFSDRFSYCCNQGFRTPKASLLFKMLGDLNMHNCIMADLLRATLNTERQERHNASEWIPDRANPTGI